MAKHEEVVIEDGKFVIKSTKAGKGVRISAVFSPIGGGSLREKSKKFPSGNATKPRRQEVFDLMDVSLRSITPIPGGYNDQRFDKEIKPLLDRMYVKFYESS